MKKYIYSILISLLVVSTLSAKDIHVGHWTITKEVDKMTGEASYCITSKSVSPLRPMHFPYRNVTANLVVEFDGNLKWIYLAFNTVPNLVGGELRDGYNEIGIRVRFDDSIEGITISHDWGSHFLYCEFPDFLLPKLVHSKTVLIELPWHGQGDVYFEFNLRGLSRAIKRLNSIQKTVKLEP